MAKEHSHLSKATTLKEFGLTVFSIKLSTDNITYSIIIPYLKILNSERIFLEK